MKEGYFKKIDDFYKSSLHSGKIGYPSPEKSNSRILTNPV
jgi:hypothetical protein